MRPFNVYNGRTLWLDARKYVHVGMIQRPLLMRTIYEQTLFNQMLKHVARVRQELYDRGIEKRLVKKKTEKRMRKVFFFPFDAAWVPGFRRSVTFKHPCLIVKQLRKQKLQREREL